MGIGKVMALSPQNLILVNKINRIPDDYDPQLVSIADSQVKVNAIIVEDLNNMLSAAEALGYDFFVVSAYRSVEYQQCLIDKEVHDYEEKGLSHKAAIKRVSEDIMPAGFSEHHTGLAIDVMCDDNYKLDETQVKEPTNIWLREHCHEFGFILRYPREKEDITGIKYEPWHFRYVGKDVAEYIMNKRIVLEEYIEEVGY